MNYVKDQGVEFMDWPPQSPDMNPIENLWKTLGQNVMARNPAKVEDLWIKLQEEWAKITVAQCQDLLKSCGRRYAAVIENKGRSTKYKNKIKIVLFCIVKKLFCSLILDT